MAFVDTSSFIARIAASDQRNRGAIKAERPGMRMITSSPVVNETVSLLQRRGMLSAALEFLQILQAECWDLLYGWAGSGACHYAPFIDSWEESVVVRQAPPHGWVRHSPFAGISRRSALSHQHPAAPGAAPRSRFFRSMLYEGKRPRYRKP
jgi:hypothetical protein